MSLDLQRLQDYLSHILEAIERIDRYTEGMAERAFLENEMARDAVIRNFEIIGEACHNIETHYPEFAHGPPGTASGLRLSDAQRRSSRLFQS